MCIAIVKKQGATISDEVLKNCFDNNRDGAGIAYARDGKLYIVKGIFKKKLFVKKVREIEKKAEGAMLIHCRIGTSGKKDKRNCHPHIVNDKTVLIHNGILSVSVPFNSKVSDTVIYIKEFLKGLPKDFMENDSICKLIEDSIGRGNKFALLNNKGEFRIINEKAGIWDKDIWYSNNGYTYNKNAVWKTAAKFENAYSDYWNKTFEDKEYEKQQQLPLTIEKPESFAYPIYNRQYIIDKIMQMDNDEFLKMGIYPVYDRLMRKLVKESETTIENPERYKYLDDIDADAYEEYMYEVELRGLTSELIPDEEQNLYRCI